MKKFTTLPRGAIIKNSSIILFVYTLFALSLLAAGQETRGWGLYAGSFDMADDRISELGLEYRLPPVKVKGVELIPALGISEASDEAFWIYGSLRYDWKLSDRWIASPQFGVSLFAGGNDGTDLGGPIEFRSGLEISYGLKQGSRVGVLFYHLSNAGIYERNPGSNSLVMVWSIDR